MWLAVAGLYVGMVVLVMRLCRLNGVVERRYYLRLDKSGHTYVWQWSDEFSQETRRQVGRAAADPEQPLDWHDAARITRCMRRMEAERD